LFYLQTCRQRISCKKHRSNVITKLTSHLANILKKKLKSDLYICSLPFSVIIYSMSLTFSIHLISSRKSITPKTNLSLLSNSNNSSTCLCSYVSFLTHTAISLVNKN
jgi:hypothetical protein